MTQLRTYLLICTLAGTAYSLSAMAEDSSMGGSPERRLEQQRAADDTRDTNKNKLTPNMMGHMAKAMQHMQQAQQARQQKNEGQAQKEEKMAMMEQMKAQQLDQQIKANEKTAQQNEAGAQKLQNQEPIKAPPKAEANPVISLRDSKYSAPPAPEKAPAAETPIPKEELANLHAVAFVPTSIKPPEKPIEAQLAKSDSPREKFGYDERAPVNEKGSPTAASASASSAPTSGPGSPSAAPIQASLAGMTIVSAPGSTGGATPDKGAGDFWTQVGNDVGAENSRVEAADKRLSLKNLRGTTSKGESKEESASSDGLPSEKLSDAAFWKKVGKEPVKCSKLINRQREKCLRTARRDYERKWKETKPAAKEKEPLQAAK